MWLLINCSGTDAVIEQFTNKREKKELDSKPIHHDAAKPVQTDSTRSDLRYSSNLNEPNETTNEPTNKLAWSQYLPAEIIIGIGDAPPPKKKNGEKIFIGQLLWKIRVLFSQKSREILIFCWFFGQESSKIRAICYFFIHIFEGKMPCPLKLTELLYAYGDNKRNKCVNVDPRPQQYNTLWFYIIMN